MFICLYDMFLEIWLQLDASGLRCRISGFKKSKVYGSLPVWFRRCFRMESGTKQKLLGCVKSQTENVTSSVWIQFVPIPASHMWKMSSISPLGRFSQFIRLHVFCHTIFKHINSCHLHCTNRNKHLNENMKKIKTSFPNFPTARHWGGIPPGAAVSFTSYHFMTSCIWFPMSQ